MKTIKLLSLVAGTALLIGGISMYTIANARLETKGLPKPTLQTTATPLPIDHSQHHGGGITQVITPTVSTGQLMTNTMPRNTPSVMTETLQSMQNMMADMQTMMVGMQGMMTHMQTMQNHMNSGVNTSGTIQNMQSMMTNMRAMMDGMQARMASGSIMSGTMSSPNGMPCAQHLSTTQNQPPSQRTP